MGRLSRLRRGFRAGLGSPNLFLRELNSIYHAWARRLGVVPDRVDVIDADWDTLLILDACRYDVFAAHSELPGRLEHRFSAGSHTSEFLAENFTGARLPAVVYTTATPQLERRRETLDVEFHALNNVWNTDCWDDELGTVPPAAMTRVARDVHDRYPHKRHVVHYFQPHYPFIGSTLNEYGRGLFDDTELELDIWERRFRGEIAVEPSDVWPAYRKNLELVLASVAELLESLDGRVVVTSDHGNMIGERSFPIPIREWGHPPGIYTEELVKVPWHVYESGERRRIVEGDVIRAEETRVRDQVVTERLADLGYDY